MKTSKGGFWITVIFSMVPVIAGVLMLLFGRSADDRTVGLATAVVVPAVIWAVYGCAYPTFKG